MKKLKQSKDVHLRHYLIALIDEISRSITVNQGDSARLLSPKFLLVYWKTKALQEIKIPVKFMNTILVADHHIIVADSIDLQRFAHQLQKKIKN